MKIAFFSTALYLASFFAGSVAEVTLGTFPEVVQVGKQYTLSWTATSNYSYTIWLIQETPGNPYAWNMSQGQGTGLVYQSLSANYTWTVPSNLNLSRFYGFWLYGSSIPFNGGGFSKTTPWFAVTTETLNATTSSSASATASATASQTATTSAVSSGTPSASPGGSSSGNSSSHHISGGAIAGIVIAIILAIAFLIGGYILMGVRRKKADKERREAAQRASRLAPVMEGSARTFEMHGRTVEANKEVNV